MRKAFVNALLNLAEANRDIVLIVGDLGFGILDAFRRRYSDRFINAGISEQNMMSVAAGLALEGKQVFVYSIANFPTLRCLEQIRNDVVYHKANVKIVAVGCGFSYGALGMSHHGTEDIAIMRALPNMTLLSPCDPIETEEVTRLAAGLDGPCYIRLGKGGEEILHSRPQKIRLGKILQLKKGNDVALLATGSIASEAIKASVELEQFGIHCSVYSFPTIKPLDRDALLDLVTTYSVIYTLEEHNIQGGFGSSIAEIICEFGTGVKMRRLGVNDEYSEIVGSQAFLRNRHQIDARGIVSCMTLENCSEG